MVQYIYVYVLVLHVFNTTLCIMLSRERSKSNGGRKGTFHAYLLLITLSIIEIRIQDA